jgi:DNA polymerase-3 subunit chi
VAVPRITFYVLPEQGSDARLKFACRLVEKAFARDHRVVVRCGSREVASEFDELLWRFSDQSFVPHEIASPGEAGAAPVIICADDDPGRAADVLVNLADDVPDGYLGFTRVAEILDASEDCRRSGRERFRHYRAQGIEPETHNLGAA